LEPAADDATRLNSVMQRALSRPATEEELRILIACLDDQRLLLAAAPEQATLIAPMTVGSEPVNEGQNIETAAWTSVCSVVLNLHEFITRE